MNNKKEYCKHPVYSVAEPDVKEWLICSKMVYPLFEINLLCSEAFVIIPLNLIFLERELKEIIEKTMTQDATTEIIIEYNNNDIRLDISFTSNRQPFPKRIFEIYQNMAINYYFENKYTIIKPKSNEIHPTSKNWFINYAYGNRGLLKRALYETIENRRKYGNRFINGTFNNQIRNAQFD